MPASRIRGAEPGDFDWILRSPHGARPIAVERALRPDRTRIAQAESGQLCGCRPAPAASVASGWGPVQAPLVPLLSTAGSEPSSSRRVVAGRDADVDSGNRGAAPG